MAIQETELQYTERLLRERLAEAEAAERARADAAEAARANTARASAARTEALLARAAKPHLPRAEKAPLPRVTAPEAPEMIQASRDSLIDGLFPQTEWPQPPRAEFPRVADKKADRRSDFVIAALGIVLGLICALFPWYIFFNQEQFGVQAIKFGGSGTNAGRVSGGSQMENPGTSATAKNIPDLDLFATSTLPDEAEPAQKAPGPDEQPFPATASEFKMVHVANGRAMIEDDTGLWIVQRGSVLPDSSHVASIEQRGGRWVIVTDANKVIELSK